MVQFRKRKSDGQSFPVNNTLKLRASNPSNDVGGLKIGSGTRLPNKELQTEIPSPDPHEGGQAVLDTLFSPMSDVNGVAFFKFVGIKKFLLEGMDTISFNQIPSNPHRIERIVVHVNRGSDLFEVIFFQKNQFIPSLTEKDVDVSILSRVLLNGLGYET